MKTSITRLDIALEKYNEIRQGLADTQAKAETLCVCWNKLDQDMTELTAALTNGGGSKITMDRLEQSINTLNSLFIERQTTIEVDESIILLLSVLIFILFRNSHQPTLSERSKKQVNSI